MADVNILKLILRNLISNSIKFSHNSGKIIISSHNIINSETDENDLVKIIVEDFGVGMSRKNLDSLFSLSSSFSTYGTNNESGNGLGLIFTKDMIERLNGNISVESKPGLGTKISFTLKKA